MNYYRTCTELRYPKMIGEMPLKWDYFSVPDKSVLPENWENLTWNDKYDFLNDNGYWTKGFFEITDDQDMFIDGNALAGMHDEVVVEFTEEDDA